MESPQAEPLQRPGRPRSLFDLPDELLIQIVSHLAADQPALCLLARTCRFFQIEAEKHIYTTIELLSTSDLHAIIEAFTRRPERIASVEALKILYRFHEGLGATSEQRNVFNQCVKRMEALRVWEIESPYDNYKWDEGGDEWVLGDMEEFRKALETASLHAQGANMTATLHVGLAKLESLTLHTHGVSDDFWDLGSFHCLFRHPSLRHLHVSCLALPPDLPELEPYTKSTPLTSLVFDECELEPRSLGRILATPKNLRHLTLGENVYNVNLSRRTNPRLTRNPEASLAALSHAAHSLQSLTHYDPASALDLPTFTHRPTPLPGPGMRDFHALNLLRVDAASFLHRSIALSHTQAPPNLSTLQIRQPRPLIHRRGFLGTISNADFFETLPPCEPYTYLASLRTLEFIQGASLESPLASPHHMCAEEPLRTRHATAYTLSKHKINLKVSLEATWRARLIPPFLHGEPPLTLVNVYDAETVGFKRLRHGRGVVEGEDGAGEREVETEVLRDEEVKAVLMEVWRRTNRTFHVMRSLAVESGSESEDGQGQGFTVVVDNGEWEDVDEDEDEDEEGEDVFWMDGEGWEDEEGDGMGGVEMDLEDDDEDVPDVHYVMDVHNSIDPDGDIEAQAQALLNAAYLAAQSIEDEEGEEDTDTDTDVD